jgi:hypothetical protein
VTIKYRHNSIASKESLAKKLGITEEYLNEILENSDLLYHANTPEKKADGSLRQTYRVEEKLKIILRKIVTNIFHHVDFPRYIQGSIKDKEKPRDYISNASVHTGKKLLIKEDIKNFFPSIKSLEVEKIWRRLFKFSPDVANALTKLTTLNGSVPQGAPTSSYLANLIFWDVEPSVVTNLSNLGITYSRYVDDITLSTNRHLSPEEKTEIIKLIYGMCLKKGIKPNRKKHAIMTSSEKMTVHGLNVNSIVPTLSKNERQNLRAAVYQCKLEFQCEGHTQKYKKLHEKTIGRIQRLNRLQSSQAKPLLVQLKKIEPVI